MIDQSTANFVSGLAGGVATVLVGHPFDTIKVRMQTSAATGVQYSGVLDCLSKTIRNEGSLAVYKGVGPPLLGTGFCTSLIFGVNRFVSEKLKSSTNISHLSRDFISGFATGAALAPIIGPMELIKVRLQVDGNSAAAKQYKGLLDCIAKSTSNGRSLALLWRGSLMTLCRDAPSFAFYFGTYDMIKNLKNPKDQTPLHLLLAGGLAGISAWIPSYPQDVLKSRIQLNHQHNRPSTVSIARSIWRKDGLQGFFRGMTPTLARAFPANAATFLAFELVSRLFHVPSFDPLDESS